MGETVVFATRKCVFLNKYFPKKYVCKDGVMCLNSSVIIILRIFSVAHLFPVDNTIMYFNSPKVEMLDFIFQPLSTSFLFMFYRGYSFINSRFYIQFNIFVIPKSCISFDIFHPIVHCPINIQYINYKTKVKSFELTFK